ALSDNQAIVRASAADALAVFKGDAVEAADPLMKLMEDNDLSVRLSAARTVGIVCPPSEKCAAGLASRLTDEREVALAALESLQAMKEYAAVAKDGLKALIQSESSELRIAALKCVRTAWTEPSEAVGVLQKGLDDGDWTVRRAAAEGLANLEKAAAPAVPKLFAMLVSDEDTNSASAALRAINTAEVDALPVLLDGLKSRERRQVYFGLYLIGQIGPDAKAAIPRLEELANETDSRRMRDSIRRTLKKIREE
ncbi:MAG TPA: hypothetical protein DCG12_20260, partial [Planctomycetaceae bacterium]|nr:hypothetical protein [Planctomycetaceae bacterium]